MRIARISSRLSGIFLDPILSRAYSVEDEVMSMKEIICEHCGIKRLKRKSDINRTKNHFCSTSCSNKFRTGKRVPNIECEYCHISLYRYPYLLKRTKHFFCSKKCSGLSRRVTNQNKSLKDYLHLNINAYHSTIRGFARTWNPELSKIPCQFCGYSIHVEYCHVKPIKDFEQNSLLKEVNLFTGFLM